MNPNELRLAFNFAAKNDIRYYLCAVLVTKTHLIASNGHRLAYIKCENELPDGMESILIPREQVDFFLKKTTKSKVYLLASINILPDKNIDGNFLLSCGNHYESFSPIDEKYPDFKKITGEIMLQPEGTGHKLQFNWNYLATAQQLLNEYMGKGKKRPDSFDLCTNEKCGFFMTDNAVIVIMPTRT